MGHYVVVGGRTGIGSAITEKLRSQGHSVAVISSTAGDYHFNALTGEMPNYLPEVLDGLVYCPGTIRLKPFHRITDDELLEEMQINALGAARVLRHFFPALKKGQSPSVVLFSTVAAQLGMPFHAGIAMAKGAVEGLVRSLAAEWAPVIRFNAIAPSLTHTPLAGQLLSTPEKMEAAGKRHPLQRIGQTADHASIACFLLSPESSWMTGQIVHADGGMSVVRT